MSSHDSIFRTDKESSIWQQNDHRDILQNLLASFIFQEECRTKIEHVLFPSAVFRIMDPCVGRSFSMCSHDLIFGTNKNRILINGSCEGATLRFCQLRGGGLTKYPFQGERVIANRYLPPGTEQNSKEDHLFMPENIFSGPNLYPLFISLVSKPNKKFVCSIFQHIIFQK